MMSRVLGILMLGVPFAAALAALPRSAPTHGVRLEHTWIPLSDGTRLVVTLYVPTGSWTVLRDEVSQRSTVTWHGTAAVSYPWGRFDHSERLIYEIDDGHPELARVQGDSEYIPIVKNHRLTRRGRPNVVSDAHTFFCLYTRTLLNDGAVIKTKTWEEPIPRDHQ